MPKKKKKRLPYIHLDLESSKTPIDSRVSRQAADDSSTSISTFEGEKDARALGGAAVSDETNVSHGETEVYETPIAPQTVLDAVPSFEGTPSKVTYSGVTATNGVEAPEIVLPEPQEAPALSPETTAYAASSEDEQANAPYKEIDLLAVDEEDDDANVQDGMVFVAPADEDALGHPLSYDRNDPEYGVGETSMFPPSRWARPQNTEGVLSDLGISGLPKINGAGLLSWEAISGKKPEESSKTEGQSVPAAASQPTADQQATAAQSSAAETAPLERAPSYSSATAAGANPVTGAGMAAAAGAEAAANAARVANMSSQAPMRHPSFPSEGASHKDVSAGMQAHAAAKRLQRQREQAQLEQVRRQRIEQQRKAATAARQQRAAAQKKAQAERMRAKKAQAQAQQAALRRKQQDQARRNAQAKQAAMAANAQRARAQAQRAQQAAMMQASSNTFGIAPAAFGGTLGALSTSMTPQYLRSLGAQPQAMPVWPQAQGVPVTAAPQLTVPGLQPATAMQMPAQVASASQQTNAQTASSASSSSDLGKPLLDEKAIEKSPMFDKPPVSIEEGMQRVDSKRKRHTVVIIALVAVLVAALATGVTFFVVLGQDMPSFLPGVSQNDGAQDGGSGAQDESGNAGGSDAGSGTSGSNGSGSGSGSGGSGGSGDTGSGANEQAGTVTYQYTATTAAGKEYTVEETVTFGEGGDCEFSTMKMMFPDEATAKSFTDALARDYGSSFTLDSLDGAAAVVTIDNSGLHLNRDEYENALRYSVRDLMVFK